MGLLSNAASALLNHASAARIAAASGFALLTVLLVSILELAIVYANCRSLGLDAMAV